MPEIALTMPSVAASVPLARHTVDRLSEALDEALLDNVRLLVSEVVTNSVRHGHVEGSVELRVIVTRARIRVEVEDHGPGFSVPGPVHEDILERSSGWGLLLVDRLADRWGVVTNLTTTVWFEIDRTAGPWGGLEQPDRPGS